MADFLHFFPQALTIANLLALLLGTIGGLVLGATPGLSPTMAVALLVPFTFHMNPATGLILLGAVYTSTVAGGAISAILINIPGAPANIATLLGLLGTIIGLIQAFTAVAQADPTQKADLLSASISVAMNTTAFGLMAAIPLLLVYAMLRSQTNQIIDSLEMASVKFLNSFTKQRPARSGEA